MSMRPRRTSSSTSSAVIGFVPLPTPEQPGPHEHVRRKTVGDRLKAPIESPSVRRGNSHRGEDESRPDRAPNHHETRPDAGEESTDQLDLLPGHRQSIPAAPLEQQVRDPAGAATGPPRPG